VGPGEVLLGDAEELVRLILPLIHATEDLGPPIDVLDPRVVPGGDPLRPQLLREAANLGDVLVVDAGNNRQCAFWGELLSTACMAKGVRGAVMSTCTRDLWALEKMDFPVFAIGVTPADSKGRIDVTAIGEPINIDGVNIKNGDYILGDADGVVIIPTEALDETLRLAQEKVAGENTVRDDLAAGMPVTEAFSKHGIL